MAVDYGSGPTIPDGLTSQTADSSGTVSWTWQVLPNTTPGSWQIVVTATLGSMKTSQAVNFTVKQEY
jgi:hypothetical protein